MTRVGRVAVFLVPSLNLGESSSVWLHSGWRSGSGTIQCVFASHPGRISSEGTSNLRFIRVILNSVSAILVITFYRHLLQTIKLSLFTIRVYLGECVIIYMYIITYSQLYQINTNCKERQKCNLTVCKR
jgi:hypothetical protein